MNIIKILEVIFIILIAIAVLIVLYVVWKSKRRRMSQKDLLEIQNNWKAIIRRTDKSHAIMEADKLLDHALYLLGYKGNLGNKLKKATPLFRSINRVWAAHKVRNNIAHQINFQIDEKTYRNTMLAFKQAFMDLKIF